MTEMRQEKWSRQFTDQEQEILHRLFPDEDSIQHAVLQVDSIDEDVPQQSDPQYFPHMVRAFASTKSLPHLTRDDAVTNLSDRIPLYESTTSDEIIMPGAKFLNGSSEGVGLMRRILPNMVCEHFNQCLLHELEQILDHKTTSDEQLKRVFSLLRDLEQGYNLKDYFNRGASSTESGLATSLLDTHRKPLSGKVSQTPMNDLRGEHSAALTPVDSDIVVTDLERQNDNSSRPRMITKERYARERRLDRLARELEMRERFIAALLGGLSLIGPMLIMAIRPSQLKTLITSSVAVLIFSLGLAWKSSAKVETLLATTAAYAAVMVVFVGINVH